MVRKVRGDLSHHGPVEGSRPPSLILKATVVDANIAPSFAVNRRLEEGPPIASNPSRSADRNKEEAAAWEREKTKLDPWIDYFERPISWINPGPTERPIDVAVVQWFNFAMQLSTSNPSPSRVHEPANTPSSIDHHPRP